MTIFYGKTVCRFLYIPWEQRRLQTRDEPRCAQTHIRIGYSSSCRAGAAKITQDCSLYEARLATQTHNREIFKAELLFGGHCCWRRAGRAEVCHLKHWDTKAKGVDSFDKYSSRCAFAPSERCLRGRGQTFRVFNIFSANFANFLEHSKNEFLCVMFLQREHREKGWAFLMCLIELPFTNVMKFLVHKNESSSH